MSPPGGRYRPSAYLSAEARLLAELLEAAEVETPMGGRAVSYEPLGVVWLACGAVRRRERVEADAAPVTLESLNAVTRADGRLRAGRMLRFRGGDWRIAGVDPDQPQPGRTTLSLERMR